MQLLRKFYLSEIYIVIVFLIALFSWSNFQEVNGILVLVILSSVGLFLNTPLVTIFPILFSFPFISRTYVSLNEVPMFYFYLGGILLISVIVFLIRNKISFNRSSMKLGFCLLAICSVLSLINLQTDGQHIRYLYSIGNVLTLVLYVIFSGIIKKDYSNYLFKTLLGLGFYLAFQLIIEGVRLGGFDNKITSLGWGGANTASIYINMAIIAAFFLLVKSKKVAAYIFYITAIAFLSFIIIITLSRAGYLALGVCFGLCTLGTLFYSKTKMKLILVGVGSVIVIALIASYNLDMIVDYVQKSFANGFDDNGRKELWDFGIRGFKEHWLIGNGLFGSNVIIQVDPNRLMPLHNTILQTLYSFGIVGIISLIIHYAQKFNMIIRKFTVTKFFFTMITLSGFIHGMLDNTYYMLAYMLILICIIAVVENSDEETEEEFIESNIELEENETIKEIKYLIKY